MQSSESDGNSNLPAPVQERGLGQWSPFDLFNQMKSEMDRVFGEFRPFARSGQWSPALDVYSEGDSTVIKAELPGVNKEDIVLSIDDGDLIIRGERKSEERTEETNYVRMERSYGSFYRRLPLPKGVTEKDVSATQADGILEVRIKQPKPDQGTAKRIPIK
jgi:HSP20 family protein